MICPECGTRLSRGETRCHFCGYEATTNLVAECHHFFEESINFFSENTNLFTIIVAIFTIISLAPLFLTFLYGENWFIELLGSPIGFDCIRFIIIATIFGVAFAYYLLWLVVINYLNKFFRTGQNLLDTIFSGIIVIMSIITIAAVSLFLLEVWGTKLSPLISFTLITWIIIATIPAFFLIVGSVIHIAQNIDRPVGKIYFYILGVAVIVIALALIAVPAYQSLDSLSKETSKYYSPKNAIVSIDYVLPNDSIYKPNLLPLKPNISNFNESDKVSILDRDFAECHWSTNYGYFISINSNNSIIKKQTDELLLPNCLHNSDKIFWTYSINDYGKVKPPVIIGLSFEDPYKKSNNKLGDSYRVFRWNQTDRIEIENNIQNFSFLLENTFF